MLDLLPGLVGRMAAFGTNEQPFRLDAGMNLAYHIVQDTRSSVRLNIIPSGDTLS